MMLRRGSSPEETAKNIDAPGQQVHPGEPGRRGTLAAWPRRRSPLPATRRRRLRQKHVIPYLFILPNLVLFAVFVLGPVLFSFGMSFTNWDGLGRAQFDRAAQLRQRC